MRIKKGFVLEKVGDSYLACATGKLASTFAGFVRMNETGAFLWRELDKEDMSESELSARLVAEYEIDDKLAANDVAAFLKKLSEHGIIEG